MGWGIIRQVDAEQPNLRLSVICPAIKGTSSISTRVSSRRSQIAANASDRFNDCGLPSFAYSMGITFGAQSRDVNYIRASRAVRPHPGHDAEDVKQPPTASPEQRHVAPFYLLAAS